MAQPPPDQNYYHHTLSHPHPHPHPHTQHPQLQLPPHFRNHFDLVSVQSVKQHKQNQKQEEANNSHFQLSPKAVRWAHRWDKLQLYSSISAQPTSQSRQVNSANSIKWTAGNRVLSFFLTLPPLRKKRERACCDLSVCEWDGEKTEGILLLIVHLARLQGPFNAYPY